MQARRMRVLVTLKREGYQTVTVNLVVQPGERASEIAREVVGKTGAELQERFGEAFARAAEHKMIAEQAWVWDREPLPPLIS